MKKNVFYFFVFIVASSLYGQNQDKIKTDVHLKQDKPYGTLIKNDTCIKRKKLALLLPFNLLSIESDTINSLITRLKKDKFLNITLDFYAGAQVAIDSAKTIGLPVDVSIFDSQETKLTSNVSKLILENQLQDFDAVIGPFYQNNVEKAADLLSLKNVPVLSPLSKDTENRFSNVYKSIPSSENLKEAMFDFMRKKEGNMLAVVDKKRESIRQYIQNQYKEVRFVSWNEKGSLSVESLQSLLVKDKMNYVILETTNTGIIKLTMQTMLLAMNNYRVQLVLLEPNETLETDEINFENLTKLKLMYPSVTGEKDTYEVQIFEKEFRKINKIAPNLYATRGFDLTFDTLMRLSQGKNYQEIIDAVATEQVNNRFEYYKTERGGYDNKGVYILYYDTDLKIKQAK
jgi:ABC-type branched-subunit amino acid transport system substrate-binding protein